MSITATREAPAANQVATASAPFEIGGEDRREAGRNHFTKALAYMLTDVSHPEMAALADWACNEEGNLHTSQISHLRNAKMRMLGVKALDALGRINTAAWAYQNDRKLLKRLNTATTTARIEETLKRYKVVLNPAAQVGISTTAEGSPMDAGDLMLLYLGYLRIDGQLGSAPEAGDHSDALAKKIGTWTDHLINEKGLSFREAAKTIKSVWPGPSASADRFCSVVAGLDEYTPAQVKEDWGHITVVLSSLIGEDLNPESLAELVATEEIAG